MTPKQHHSILVAYLTAKTYEQDWHGVSDAANDLRVLEAQHPTASHSEQCACCACDRERAA
jgi:hypothetical protein